MDTVKTGTYFATLRKNADMTQQEVAGRGLRRLVRLPKPPMVHHRCHRRGADRGSGRTV